MANVVNGVEYRVLDGVPVKRREADDYIDATTMCKSHGKRWNDYWRNEKTQEFLAELATAAGIPAAVLVQVKEGGRPGEQGTWVHPRVAMHLAQWCSPKFAVLVSEWVLELLTAGRVEIDPRAGADRVLEAVGRMVAEFGGKLTELTGAVVGLAGAVSGMAERQERLEGRVAALEARPENAAADVREQMVEAKQAYIIRELRDDPARTDKLVVRDIAAKYRVRVDHTTVRRHRHRMEGSREIEPAPRRRDVNGRTVVVGYGQRELPFHTDIDAIG